MTSYRAACQSQHGHKGAAHGVCQTEQTGWLTSKLSMTRRSFSRSWLYSTSLALAALRGDGSLRSFCSSACICSIPCIPACHYCCLFLKDRVSSRGLPILVERPHKLAFMAVNSITKALLHTIQTLTPVRSLEPCCSLPAEVACRWGRAARHDIACIYHLELCTRPSEASAAAQNFCIIESVHFLR